MKTALLILALLAAPCSAQDRDWRPASDVIVPPPAYDPLVRGWPKNVRIVEVPFAKMQAMCNIPRVQACYQSKYRRIVIPSGMPADLRAATLRHEGAHAYGWKHPLRGK